MDGQYIFAVVRAVHILSKDCKRDKDRRDGKDTCNIQDILSSDRATIINSSSPSFAISSFCELIVIQALAGRHCQDLLSTSS